MIDTSLQRVLFVNSGGFRLCDIDLSKSIHLYGGNNAGKTTIVNALQFAFIDNFKQMVWDGHKDDETKKHYFDLFSYIVFEVSTPTGPQCLALLGQGPGQSFGYQRWRYNGTLELESYIAEDGDGKFKPRDNQFVKSYFAKMEAKGPLSGKEMQQWITGRGESPFSVAPLKRSNDFPKYKKVFTNLLRLEKLTSLEMRELLVACSDVVTNELNLRDKYENRYNEFLGKQNEILMINNARDTLESCIEDFVKLSAIPKRCATLFQEKFEGNIIRVVSFSLSSSELQAVLENGDWLIEHSECACPQFSAKENETALEISLS